MKTPTQITDDCGLNEFEGLMLADIVDLRFGATSGSPAELAIIGALFKHIQLLTENTPQARLEYLRRELRAERMSHGELHELQSLVKHIDPGDVELLEAAGVPEGTSPEDMPEDTGLFGGVIPEGAKDTTPAQQEALDATLPEEPEDLTNELIEVIWPRLDRGTHDRDDIQCAVTNVFDSWTPK